MLMLMMMLLMMLMMMMMMTNVLRNAHSEADCPQQYPSESPYKTVYKQDVYVRDSRCDTPRAHVTIKYYTENGVHILYLILNKLALT